jgi:hypothetical protein
VQAIKKLSSFFNTVRQAIFHFKPNGFDSRKARGANRVIDVLGKGRLLKLRACARKSLIILRKYGKIIKTSVL